MLLACTNLIIVPIFFSISFHSTYKSDITQSILVLSFHFIACTNKTPYNPFSLQHFILQVVQIKRHIIHSRFITSFHRAYKSNPAQSTPISSLHSTARTHQTYYAIYSRFITLFYRKYKLNITQSILVPSPHYIARTNQTPQSIPTLSLHSTGCTHQAIHNPFPSHHLIPQIVQIKHHTIHTNFITSFHRLYKSNTTQFIRIPNTSLYSAYKSNISRNSSLFQAFHYIASTNQTPQSIFI